MLYAIYSNFLWQRQTLHSHNVIDSHCSQARYQWRHWAWWHPGRQTDGVTLFFWKNWRPFLVIALSKVISDDLLAVLSSPLSSSHVVYRVFFLNSATKNKFHSGVTPWMVSPGADRPQWRHCTLPLSHGDMPWSSVLSTGWATKSEANLHFWW